MKRAWYRSAAGLLAAVLLLSGWTNAAPETAAHSAILMDIGGRVLYEQNADEKSLIASTTKIMTGFLTAEYADLEEVVSVPSEAVGIEGSSLYLKAGEALTYRDLLYGLMLQSGNDAAVAIAVLLCGSTEAFTELMNETAQEFGLTQTHYANPHGLDSEENYSTARDLARLTARALQNGDFAEVVRTKTADVPGRKLTNHNKLLWQYPGAIGVKTGYTLAAGRILVSAAERNGRTLIAVTINDRQDWRDHAALLDHGFSFYSQELFLRQTELFSVPVEGAPGRTADAASAEDLTFPVSDREQVELCVWLPASVRAPLRNGDPAGLTVLRVDGRSVAAVPLYWQTSLDASLPRRSIFSQIFGGT